MSEVKEVKQELQVMPTRIVEMVNLSELEGVIMKINQFQQLVRTALKDGVDYGTIPNTGSKPTLKKPGAEKICMLLGLRSEFEIMNQTRDFKVGFFQYQMKCKLYRGDILITEGIGACNTRESKYRKSDGFSIDNTVLKMAKKRALVDASLMVGSLSDIFTQDIEDMDLNDLGNNYESKNTEPKNTEPKNIGKEPTISEDQWKRLYAIAKGNSSLIKSIIVTYGYKEGSQVKRKHYKEICEKVQEKAQN